MAGTWTSDRFPQFKEAIQKLTKQHQELEDEPLHLAIAFAPPSSRDQQDIYLFEVIGGSSGINPERDLFEATFAPTPGFATGFNQDLHLVLTNPPELKQALNELDRGWPMVKEIVRAVRADDYRVLHADPIGKTILKRIRNVARHHGETVSG